jgi:hypothetical protein
MMVQSFVAGFAKAARVSDVPEEAIMSDTREPSYMFLAAEWNRSSVSERAYLLAMLFGREFVCRSHRARRPWRGTGQRRPANQGGVLTDTVL